MRKWDAIDDEIWAKAIVMERNKRVAKVRMIECIYSNFIFILIEHKCIRHDSDLKVMALFWSF